MTDIFVRDDDGDDGDEDDGFELVGSGHRPGRFARQSGSPFQPADGDEDEDDDEEEDRDGDGDGMEGIDGQYDRDTVGSDSDPDDRPPPGVDSAGHSSRMGVGGHGRRPPPHDRGGRFGGAAGGQGLNNSPATGTSRTEARKNWWSKFRPAAGQPNHCAEFATYGYNPLLAPKFGTKIDKVWIRPRDFDSLPSNSEEGSELHSIGFECWRHLIINVPLWAMEPGFSSLVQFRDKQCAMGTPMKGELSMTIIQSVAKLLGCVVRHSDGRVANGTPDAAPSETDAATAGEPTDDDGSGADGRKRQKRDPTTVHSYEFLMEGRKLPMRVASVEFLRPAGTDDGSANANPDDDAMAFRDPFVEEVVEAERSRMQEEIVGVRVWLHVLDQTFADYKIRHRFFRESLSKGPANRGAGLSAEDAVIDPVQKATRRLNHYMGSMKCEDHLRFVYQTLGGGDGFNNFPQHRGIDRGQWCNWMNYHDHPLAPESCISDLCPRALSAGMIDQDGNAIPIWAPQNEMLRYFPHRMLNKAFDDDILSQVDPDLEPYATFGTVDGVRRLEDHLRRRKKVLTDDAKSDLDATYGIGAWGATELKEALDRVDSEMYKLEKKYRGTPNLEKPRFVVPTEVNDAGLFYMLNPAVAGLDVLSAKLPPMPNASDIAPPSIVRQFRKVYIDHDPALVQSCQQNHLTSMFRNYVENLPIKAVIVDDQRAVNEAFASGGGEAADDDMNTVLSCSRPQRKLRDVLKRVASIPKDYARQRTNVVRSTVERLRSAAAGLKETLGKAEDAEAEDAGDFSSLLAPLLSPSFARRVDDEQGEEDEEDEHRRAWGGEALQDDEELMAIKAYATEAAREYKRGATFSYYARKVCEAARSSLIEAIQQSDTLQNIKKAHLEIDKKKQDARNAQEEARRKETEGRKKRACPVGPSAAGSSAFPLATLCEQQQPSVNYVQQWTRIFRRLMRDVNPLSKADKILKNVAAVDADGTACSSMAHLEEGTWTLEAFDNLCHEVIGLVEREMIKMVDTEFERTMTEFHDFALQQVYSMLCREREDLPSGLVRRMDVAHQYLSSDTSMRILPKTAKDPTAKNLSPFGELLFALTTLAERHMRFCGPIEVWLHLYLQSYESVIDKPKWALLVFGKRGTGKSESILMLDKLLLVPCIGNGSASALSGRASGKDPKSGNVSVYDELPQEFKPDNERQAHLKEMLSNQKVTHTKTIEFIDARGQKRHKEAFIETEHQEKLYCMLNQAFLCGASADMHITESHLAWLSRLMALYFHQMCPHPEEKWTELIEAPEAKNLIARLRKVEAITLQALVCQNCIPDFDPHMAYSRGQHSMCDAALSILHDAPPVGSRQRHGRDMTFIVCATLNAVYTRFIDHSGQLLFRDRVKWPVPQPGTSEMYDMRQLLDLRPLLAHPPPEIAWFTWTLHAYAHVGVSPIFLHIAQAFASYLGMRPSHYHRVEKAPDPLEQAGPSGTTAVAMDVDADAGLTLPDPSVYAADKLPHISLDNAEWSKTLVAHLDANEAVREATAAVQKIEKTAVVNYPGGRDEQAKALAKAKQNLSEAQAMAKATEEAYEAAKKVGPTVHVEDKDNNKLQFSATDGTLTPLMDPLCISVEVPYYWDKADNRAVLANRSHTDTNLVPDEEELMRNYRTRAHVLAKLRTEGLTSLTSRERAAIFPCLNDVLLFYNNSAPRLDSKTKDPWISDRTLRPAATAAKRKPSVPRASNAAARNMASASRAVARTAAASDEASEAVAKNEEEANFAEAADTALDGAAMTHPKFCFTKTTHSSGKTVTDVDHVVLKDNMLSKSYHQVGNTLAAATYCKKLGIPEIAITDGLRVLNNFVTVHYQTLGGLDEDHDVASSDASPNKNASAQQVDTEYEARKNQLEDKLLQKQKDLDQAKKDRDACQLQSQRADLQGRVKDLEADVKQLNKDLCELKSENDNRLAATLRATKAAETDYEYMPAGEIVTKENLRLFSRPSSSVRRNTWTARAMVRAMEKDMYHPVAPMLSEATKSGPPIFFRRVGERSEKHKGGKLNTPAGSEAGSEGSSTDDQSHTRLHINTQWLMRAVERHAWASIECRSHPDIGSGMTTSMRNGALVSSRGIAGTNGTDSNHLHVYDDNFESPGALPSFYDMEFFAILDDIARVCLHWDDKSNYWCTTCVASPRDAKLLLGIDLTSRKHPKDDPKTETLLGSRAVAHDLVVKHRSACNSRRSVLTEHQASLILGRPDSTSIFYEQMTTYDTDERFYDDGGGQKDPWSGALVHVLRERGLSGQETQLLQSKTEDSIRVTFMQCIMECHRSGVMKEQDARRLGVPIQALRAASVTDSKVVKPSAPQNHERINNDAGKLTSMGAYTHVFSQLGN